MVGRAVELQVRKTPARPGAVAIDVSGLTVYDDRGQVAVNDLSLQVRAGEILGIAGVQGNGQTELCEALMGLRPAAGGSVRLDSRDLSHAAPRQRLRAGRWLHPRGPARGRACRGLSRRRQPDPRRLRQAAVRQGHRARPRRDPRRGGNQGRRVRRQDDVHRHACRHAVRRQPAKGHPGQGDRTRN